MRRVLLLAYYFPPVGGGGVQRSVKFVKYLPELGYEPVVVTGPGPTLEWAPADNSLSGQIPPGTEIRRLAGPEPQRSGGWRGRAERWLRLRTPFARWWAEGVVEAGRRVPDVDLVYASMSPFETAEAAATLARELGRPWVADLRDPWALDEWRVYPTGHHRRLELRAMGRALASADAIVMNTPEAATRLRERFPELAGERISTITNGFDEADFDGPAPERADSAFRIVHAGWSHAESGRRHRHTRLARRLLGGAQAGLDILPRSHVYLVQAVERLIAERPELASVVEVHLAGHSGPETSPVVHNHGFLSHRDTVRLLRSADLLFLPMHDLPAGVRSTIVPGKTYEYLAARRPILAALPEGDARDLLAEAGVAALVRPADVDGMVAAIASAVDRRAQPAPPEDVLARYERRRLAADLAGVFDELEVVGDRRDDGVDLLLGHPREHR